MRAPKRGRPKLRRGQRKLKLCVTLSQDTLLQTRAQARELNVPISHVVEGALRLAFK